MIKVGSGVGVVLVSLAGAACGGSEVQGTGASSGGPPADFAGRYTVAVTNRDNSCNYANWSSGQSARDLTFNITQSGAELNGNLLGVGNIYFALLGIGTLKGQASGSTTSLTALGTTRLTQGLNCIYSVRATADLTLTGNGLDGTVTYRDETNHGTDCGILETCFSQQSVSGSRPPK